MVTLTGGSGNDILTGTIGSDVLTGVSGDDSLYGGNSADSLYGGDGNDLLQGGSGADRLEGGAGIDTADYITAAAAVTVSLATGTGTAGDANGDVLVAVENIEGSNFNDNLTGSTGANLLSGGAGNDTLAGGGGLDTLAGGTGLDTASFAASTAAVTVNLTTGVNTGGYAAGVVLTGIENLLGSTYNDRLTGDTNANGLFGGAGNDTLMGGGGNDTIDGGTGTDTADYITSGSGVSLNLTTGVYTGGDAAGDSLVAIENLSGSDFADSLTGNTAANVLTGNAGDDSLSGGGGVDSLYGGADNDKLTGGSGSDLLDGGAGIDVADYAASTARVVVNLATGVNTGGDAAGDTITGIENLAGSAYNDILTGNTGNNYLWGGLGADQLNGGDGNDTLAGGAGVDTISGGQGMDYLDYSASGSAVSVNLSTWVALYGDAQGDVISGSDGIIGSAFDDTLIGFNDQGLVGDVYTNAFYGGGGNDYIDGLGSNDDLYGGSDNDTVAGGLGDDSVYGGDGNDSLLGGDGADLADGGAGNDSIYGGAGNDSLYGGGSNDLLSGGAGADLLSGGDGDDTMVGGAGDTIDGSGSGNDVLDLTGSGAPFRIIRDPLNPGNGIIEYLDPLGAVIGTLTFTNIETIVCCFTPGTQIATIGGTATIESLKIGDLVMTRDHGPQPIRWIGQRHIGPGELMCDPSLQPILIRQGSLGQGLPECDMTVSRQHRMLISGPKAELMFGVNELLVRAQHLTCLAGIDAVYLSEVTYLHMLFDCHELVLADGAWSESFQPGERSLDGLADGEKNELFKIFPNLSSKEIPQQFDSARVTLKSYEARALLLA